MTIEFKTGSVYLNAAWQPSGPVRPGTHLFNFGHEACYGRLRRRQLNLHLVNGFLERSDTFALMTGRKWWPARGDQV